MSKASIIIEKRISEYKAKPLVPLEYTELMRKFNAPNISLESLKTELVRDPVFCWMLISAANEATKNRLTQPYAADHALSTIGLGKAKQLVKRFKSKGLNSLTIEVKCMLSSSLLAAELAKQIGELLHANSQSYWTALCYRLPDILLWYMHPKNMWRIYYRQLTIPKRMKLFEESKLGFNLHEWRIAVAKEFHLSEQVQALFTKDLPTEPKEIYRYTYEGFSDSTPSLAEWDRYEGWLIVLANRLALAILIPWHNSSYRHLVRLIHRLAGCDLKKLNKVINDSVRNVAINLQGADLPNPGVAHLILTSQPQFPDWLPQSRLIEARQKTVQATKLQSNLLQVIKTLEMDAESFESSTFLVHHGLKAMIDELRFSRVSFLTIDYDNKKVLTRIALNQVGCEKIRPDFDFNQPTPLDKFIEKQAFMFFDNERHQNIWAKLPSAIQKAPINKFILCSLMPGKRVRAIIYGDARDNRVFEPLQIKLVKKLLIAINKGLINRNESKQKDRVN